MANSRAQIIATIGPVTRSASVMRQLIKHQMDVARLNFSWGTYDEHRGYINTIRKSAKQLKRRIPIIQDLSGPRITRKGGHHFNASAKQALTKKDLRDLEFGLEQKIDYVAMSYVGNASDVLKLKDLIKEKGASIPVIAKIERRGALKHIDKIIEVSDAVMIARGDLGEAIPLEKIPLIEKKIIEKCKKAGKPSITATQMLLSMTTNKKPTRAEVTDVFFAIMNGSDAVMLSEETASGKYPVRAVAMMEKITREAEKSFGKKVNPL